MKSNVRRITDGAVISAIMGLLIVLDGNSGLLLDGLLFWIIPLPILVYTVKYDFKSGLMVSVAVTILAFILSVPHVAILVGFSNLIGLAYGFGVNKHLKNSMIITITFLVTLLYYVLSMQVFAAFFGYDAIAELNSMIEFFSSIIGDNYTDPVAILKVINPFFRMLITFPLFLPAVISILQTIITNMVAKIILKRLKLAELVSGNLFNLKLSKRSGLILIGILILSIVYTLSMSSAFDNVIILLQFLIELVFIMFGILLLMTYAMISHKPWLSIIITLVTIGAPYIMFAFGIIDVFTNARINIVRRYLNARESWKT